MDDRLRRVSLVLSPWPLLPSCVLPGLVGKSPRTALKRGAYLVSFGALAGAVAVLQPLLLAVLGTASGTATLAQLWYARAGWGTRRGLPPGRLPTIPVAGYLRHDGVGRILRLHGPVAKARLPRYATSNTVCVHGLALGAQTLRQEEAGSLRWPGIVYDGLIPAGFLRSMAPTEHTTYRRAVRAALADDVVDAARPEIAAHARGAVAALARGSARGPRGIDIQPELRLYVLRSLVRLFYGLAPGTEAWEQLHDLYAETGPLGETPRGGHAAIEPGALIAHGILEREMRRATDPADPPVPSFAGRLAETAPGSLDDRNLTMNLVAACATSIRDVTGLLHWIVTMLAEAAEWQDRAHLDRGGTVRTWITLETLRLEQSEYITRRVVEPVTVGAHTIPSGWYLRVCVRESHRTGEAFDRPEAFDPGRFESSRFRRSDYSPFGMGRHSCLGVSTTMAIAEEFIDALTQEHVATLAARGRPEYLNDHWRPGRRQRVRLRPRPVAATS